MRPEPQLVLPLLMPVLVLLLLVLVLVVVVAVVSRLEPALLLLLVWACGGPRWPSLACVGLHGPTLGFVGLRFLRWPALVRSQIKTNVSKVK